MPCQMVPPTAPMANAPPKSFRMTHGHGSRVWSACDMLCGYLQHELLDLLDAKVDK